MQGVRYPLVYDLVLKSGKVAKPTKKGLRAAIAANPSRVVLIATSVFGNEYRGRLSEAPAGTYYVVGPDAYRDRSWYATITVSDGPDGRRIIVR